MVVKYCVGVNILGLPVYKIHHIPEEKLLRPIN